MQTVAGFTVNVGGATINASANNTLALGNLTARSTGGTVIFNSNTSGNITIAQANQASGILAPWAVFGGTSYATATGGGPTFTLAAYSGATPATAANMTSATTNYSVASGTALGTLGNSVAGNTLQFAGSLASSLAPNTANGLMLNGILSADSGGATITGDGGSLIAGTTINGANELVIMGTQPLTINAPIINNGNGTSVLTYGGTSVLTLTGANTYSGGTFINAGTLQIGTGGTTGSLPSTGTITDNATLVFYESGNLTQGTAITGSGALTQAGTGTVTLSNADTYSGFTTVNAGTLSVTGSLSSSSALRVGGGTFSYAPAGTGNTQTVGGLTINPGGSTVNASNGNTLALGVVTRVASNGGTVNFNSTTSGNISTTNGLSNGAIGTTSNGLSNGLLGTWAVFAGTSYATVNSNGTISAFSTPTIGNTTNITSNSTNYTIAANTALSPTGTNTANSVQFLTGGASSLTPNAAGFTVNGILSTDSGGATINSGGGSLFVGGNRELVIMGTQPLTINAVIGNNTTNASALTYGGNSTLTLGGANTYTNQTYINAGTLSISTVATSTTPQPLGENTSATAVTLGGGTLQYTGSVGTLDKPFTVDPSNTGTIKNTGGSLLTLSGTLTKTGAILVLNGGTGGINVTGLITGTNTGNFNSDLDITGGATTLTHADNYFGPTVIYGNGTLINGLNSALPSTTTVALGSATLESGTNTNTYTLGGFNQTIAGLTSANSGNDTNTVIGGSGTLSTLTINNSIPDTYGGVLGNGTAGVSNANNLALVMSGSSVLTITGSNNSYSGQTTISAGTLSVNAVATGSTLQPLGVNGNLALGGASTPGTLLYTGGTGILDKSITVGTGNGTISNTGGGILTLSGTINKNAAVLSLGGGSFVLSNVISGSSAGSDLNIIGGATVGETIANTYNGPTSISGNSTLLAGVDNVLPNTGNLSAVTLGAATDAGGTNTLDLLGGNQTIASLVATGNATNQIISSNGNATTPAIGGSASSGTGSLTIAYSGNSTDTYGGTLGDAGAVRNNFSVIMSGNGTLALTGVNTYLGGTTINSGTLALAPNSGTNNIALSKFIAVGAGATFGVANVGGTGINAFALNGTGNQTTSQILGGSGTVTGAVAIANGATLSAGTNKGTGLVNGGASALPATGSTDTIGTLTTGNLTLGSGGNFAVKVSDAVSSGNTGSAGTNYDTVAAGALTVPTSPAISFNVQMLSYGNITAPAANTASANFDPTVSNTWQIASYTSTSLTGAPTGVTEVLTGPGSVGNADAGLFTLDTSNFATANGGLSTSNFYLEAIGGTGTTGTLDLVYAATPEPGTMMLVLSGAVPMLMGRRRRRISDESSNL
jgi:fibronectin-binding autotransporter adhesin